MKYICPLIVVKDIKISRKFYEKILNQTVKYDLGENITFDGDFAIHLSSHYQNLIINRAINYGSNNFELYFEEDNLEQLTEVLKQNNVEFVHEIMEQPWRQKVVRFYDPDNHIIEVGESLEHLVIRLHNEGIEISKIQEITFMPKEFILNAIQNYSK